MVHARKMLAAIAVLLFLVCSTHLLRAQVTTATVTGTVLDSTGAVVPGATLILKNSDNNVIRQETSGPDGSFHFEFVVVGRYELTVKRAGFKTETVTGLQLNTSATVDIPVHLTVAQQSETVQVNGSDAEALQTVTSDQEQVLPAADLNTLPVQHQDWTTMLPLDTATIKPLSTTTAASTSPQGSGLNVNGLASVGYNLTVDGTNATSNPEFTAFNFYQGPNIVNTVNNDAIAEVSLTKGIAPATVGNTLSSNINLITKSGTNQYHGSLYEINETADYDARTQFATVKPGKVFNEYGGSVGGFIVKDKLFGFGSYTGGRLSQLESVSGTVLTPYFFSSACTATNPSNTAQTAPCYNPVYAPLFALVPTVTQAQASGPTALTATYQGVGANTEKDGNGVARFDYYFNPKNQAYARYIRSRPFELIPNYIPSAKETYAGHMDAFNANYTHLGTQWTANTRFGFNELKLSRTQDGIYENLPTLTYDGFSSQGGTTFPQHGNIMSFEEGLVFVHGKHSLQFGGIAQRTFASRFKFATATITYASAWTFSQNTPDSVLDSVVSMPAGYVEFGWTTWEMGGYVQDDYRVTQNLTLNLGFRYDYYTVPQELQGRVYNRGIDPNNPQFGWGFGPFRPSNSMYNATYTNFQPRLGFAWVTPFDQKFVIRGGAGRYAVNHTIYGGPVDVYGLPASNGIVEPLNFTVNQAQAESVGLDYPVNGALYTQDLQALQAAGALGTNLAFENVAGYFPDPTSLQYFLGAERQLPYGLVAKADLIETRGTHLNFFETQNLVNRITDVAPEPTFGTFLQFQGGDRSNFNGLETQLVKSLRHGFEIGGTYTYGKVLSFGDADLLQPTEVQNNACPQCDYGPAPFDIRNRVTINGIWRLPLNEWTHTQGYAAREILGGWELGGIFTGQSGLPINVTNSSSSYPADRPNWASGPKYVPGYRKFGAGLKHQYLNPCIENLTSDTGSNSCTNFAPQDESNEAYNFIANAPASGSLTGKSSNAQSTPGNLQRYGQYAPGYEDLDLSLKKVFTLGEQRSFQLRMDAFDSLNHTNLTGVVATVNSSNFGQLTTSTPGGLSSGARQIQIGGRFQF
jgi:Carboxypeptidase regulatory-like domain/TonB dependent receptor